MEKKIKILVIGEPNVGKTSIINNYCNVSRQSGPTVAIDVKCTKVDNYEIIFYDTPGQTRFRDITKNYLRGIHGVFIVYDITDRESFTEASNHWVEFVIRESPSSVIYLIGNKADKESERRVDRHYADEVAKSKNLLFEETSVTTNQNIKNLLSNIIPRIVEKNILGNEESVLDINKCPSNNNVVVFKNSCC